MSSLDTSANPLLKTESLWYKSWVKLKSDRLGSLGAAIVLLYFLTALAVWMGLWGSDWATTSDAFQQAPSWQHWFGTNAIGQDVAERAIYSTKVAFEVGLLVTIMATFLGALLGAVSGYHSGRLIDSMVLWLMGVLDSIPFYLFVAAVAYALHKASFAMHVAMIAVFWTTTARIIRAEVIKLKHQEFVEAAQSLGVRSHAIIFKHILPNTSHLLLVQATITFVAAIKTEVILSFLGLGVKNGISWGLMISEATNDIQAGYFNNFVAASLFLFILVIGFNFFSDAVQDALDPKKIS